MPYSHPLGPHECEALLRSCDVGRVAVSTPGGPHIVPVNYAVVDGAVVLRTTPYSVLGSHGRDAMLAFEVDHVDPIGRRGWSVVARGRGEAVTDRQEQQLIERTWSPQPWASGPRPLFLRLVWNELTGRQLGRDWDPLPSLQQLPHDPAM